MHRFHTLVSCSCLLALSSINNARGQGEIVFNNGVPGIVDAPVFDTDCQTRLGRSFLAQVYGGLAADTLQPLGPVTSFRTSAAGAGYIEPVSVTVPGAGESQLVYAQTSSLGWANGPVSKFSKRLFEWR